MGNEPTELTIDDIENFLKKIKNGDYDLKSRPCFGCDKEFFPNYDDMKCDQCFFDQFPKKQVQAFCKKWIDENL